MLDEIASHCNIRIPSTRPKTFGQLMYSNEVNPLGLTVSPQNELLLYLQLLQVCYFLKYANLRNPRLFVESGRRRWSRILQGKAVCGIWRGICLISAVAKILTKINLQWMKEHLERVIDRELPGFRSESSCIDLGTVRGVQIFASAAFHVFRESFRQCDQEVYQECST